MNWNSYIFIAKDPQDADNTDVWFEFGLSLKGYAMKSIVICKYGIHIFFKRYFGDQRWKTTWGMRQFWWTDEGFWVWFLNPTQCNANNTNIHLYFELPWCLQDPRNFIVWRLFCFVSQKDYDQLSIFCHANAIFESNIFFDILTDQAGRQTGVHLHWIVFFAHKNNRGHKTWSLRKH